MILLPKFVINILYYPLFIIALFSKYLTGILSKITYKFRQLNRDCAYMVDMRYCIDKDNYEFPFTKCVKFICENEVNQEIKLSDEEFHNLRNVGIEKQKRIRLKDLKNYCKLPEDIAIIRCELFPWETLKNGINGENEFTIDHDTSDFNF
jgi:hypothetical protein